MSWGERQKATIAGEQDEPSLVIWLTAYCLLPLVCVVFSLSSCWPIWRRSKSRNL
ncbi:hypothetical protein STW0522RAO56_13770 [Raoultella planticola]|nr:hypothetical protein STW0522RAO56_13770 [Raoultella planticola]